MTRIALCDDDAKILSEVSAHVKQYATKKGIADLEVFCFGTAAELFGALDGGQGFDIFLLDVYIGSEMGTALARDLRRRGIESPVIFLTTSLEHAPESFETGTLRYLIKPLDPAKLYGAMDAAIAMAERVGERLIKLKSEKGVESVNASHILYSEAHDHYQYVILDDGSEIKVRMTVAELYRVLMKNDGFVRVGSAYIVNLRNIKKVTTSEVHLYHGITIPIPRGKHTELKRAFWSFQCDGEEG